MMSRGSILVCCSLLIFPFYGNAQADVDAVPSSRAVSKLMAEAARDSATSTDKERIYRKVLQLSPEHPKAMFHLALLFQKQKKFKPAERLYKKYLSVNPNDGMVHYLLANILLKLENSGGWQAAAWHLRQCIQYDTNRIRLDRARKMLGKLEMNINSINTPYRITADDGKKLLSILAKIDPNEQVRGRSKYDGPRLPLMLNFTPQSAELSPEAKLKLDSVASVLKLPVLAKDLIQIEGYTDSREHSVAKQRMIYASQRAQAVRDYFVNVHGLRENRFVLKAFADLEIFSTNETVEGRAMNRRVELYNVSRGGKVVAPLHH